MVTWIIDSFAKPELREHYVPKMAAGEDTYIASPNQEAEAMLQV